MKREPLPLPENVPPYNALPTGPRPKKFKLFKVPDSLEGYYSPFWPLLIVFFAFILLFLYEVSFLRHRSMTLRAQNARLANAVQKADAQIAFIQGLHSDLESLAPTHPAAAKLLKEFFSSVPAATPDSDDPSKTPEK